MNDNNLERRCSVIVSTSACGASGSHYIFAVNTRGLCIQHRGLCIPRESENDVKVGSVSI